MCVCVCVCVRGQVGRGAWCDGRARPCVGACPAKNKEHNLSGESSRGKQLPHSHFIIMAPAHRVVLALCCCLAAVAAVSATPTSTTHHYQTTAAAVQV